MNIVKVQAINGTGKIMSYQLMQNVKITPTNIVQMERQHVHLEDGQPLMEIVSIK